MPIPALQKDEPYRFVHPESYLQGSSIETQSEDLCNHLSRWLCEIGWPTSTWRNRIYLVRLVAVVFSESSQGPLVDTLMPPLPGSFLDLAARACADAVAAAGKVKMLRTWGQVWLPRRPLTWAVSMPSIVMILMGFQYFCVHGIWYRCVLALVICDSMPSSFKKWCVA